MLEYVGTTTYCGMLRIACLDRSFGCNIFAFGVVKSIFCVAVRHLCDDLDDVDHSKSNYWVRMSLEKKHVSDSVSIVSLFIENEVND